MDYSDKDIIWLFAEKNRLSHEWDVMWGDDRFCKEIMNINDELQLLNNEIEKRKIEIKEFETELISRELGIKKGAN